MSLNRQLINHGHVHRFTVTVGLEGWNLREDEDSAVLRLAHHDDWHRVERDATLFDIKALALKRDGWIEN